MYTPDSPAPECSNPIPDAQEIASNMAEYIAQNARNFSAALVAAAQNAIEDWQGTGLGVAASVTAAMEFIGVVMAGLSFGDAFVMLAAIAIGIATLYELLTTRVSK